MVDQNSRASRHFVRSGPICRSDRNFGRKFRRRRSDFPRADISSTRVGVVGRCENFGRKFGPPTDSAGSGPPVSPPTGWWKKISVHGARSRSVIFSPRRTRSTKIGARRSGGMVREGVESRRVYKWGTYFIYEYLCPGRAVAPSGASWRRRAQANEHRAVRRRINWPFLMRALRLEVPLIGRAGDQRGAGDVEIEPGGRYGARVGVDTGQ
jgi:hypothetical protein